ncbi:SCP2 sterol-binding domain-containing protein [Bacillus tianshenii]|nr:SCP2 sterol-binding domain-containing protein [Bacillus tianshenii]
MVVHKALIDLQNRFSLEGHLLSLVKEEPLAVQLITESEVVTFVLRGLEITVMPLHQSAQVIIKGDECELLELLSGRQPLRRLLNQGHLQVAGNYRSVLRIESVLYCCSNEQKKISV